MENIRCVLDNNKLWFPVVDLTRYSKQGKSLHPAATRWLKNNLVESGIKKLRFKGTTVQRGGDLLCVDSDNLRIVGMYEKHLQAGKDFRAKWSELPDTPCFPTDTKKELSWRNLYTWSKTDHQKNSGLCQKRLAELRNLYFIAESRLDVKHPHINEVMSLKEVLQNLELK